MRGGRRLALDGGDAAYAARVLGALDRRRLAAVGLTTLLLSLGSLVSPTLLDFLSPLEIAGAWFEYLLELAVIATSLLVVYTLLNEGLPGRTLLRLPLICALVFAAAAVLALLLYSYYAGGFTRPPSALRLLADSLRLGLPAVFLALIADVHQRALRADSAAHAAELARAQLGQGEMEQQLALLQAQIEPHFLFNVLGNVRRLYRAEPQAGADAITSLMRYLRSALPQVRSASGSLGDEIDLVRSFLELYRMRMGGRMTFAIEADPALNGLAFPPMLLVTLAENAIRHGLEPAGGGHVIVQSRRLRGALEVAVLDDGAGFGSAAISGTGVGLANVRRQLVARYARQGRLTLEAREPRGARASITIPLPARHAVGPVAGEAAVA